MIFTKEQYEDGYYRAMGITEDMVKAMAIQEGVTEDQIYVMIGTACEKRYQEYVARHS